MKNAGSDPNDFRGATHAGALPWLQAPRFRDRQEAGKRLAEALAEYENRPDVLVLALPRGGVPVGAEVASALDVAMDLMLVRKLGVPGHRELAMGAVATGGIRVLNEDVVRTLGLDDEAIEAVARGEQRELERRDEAYRGGRRPSPVADRVVILVDDGLATGATMRAAIAALKTQRPDRIVVAVPVAPPDTCEALREEADQVLCLAEPDPFMAIGVWYEDFPQLTDDEVRALLGEGWARAKVS
jgi:putative phosphoribosyl transferase